MIAKLFFAAAVAGSLGLVGCSHGARESSEKKVDSTARAAAQTGARHFTVVEFNKNSRTLTEATKSGLRDLAAEAARTGRDVEEVKVLAWADREYPASGSEATRKDIDLAENRADAISDYLNEINSRFDVEEHNMAKRPGRLARILRTEDFKTKAAFEATGAAPVKADDSERFIGSKASKAVILVEYERN